MPRCMYSAGEVTFLLPTWRAILMECHTHSHNITGQVQVAATSITPMTVVRSRRRQEAQATVVSVSLIPPSLCHLTATLDQAVRAVELRERVSCIPMLRLLVVAW